MSDKNEYREEARRGDPPEIPAGEPGISDLGDLEEESYDFSIDESFFQPEDDLQGEGGHTNIIPPEVKDVSAYTGANRRVSDAAFLETDGDDFGDYEDFGDFQEEDDEDEVYEEDERAVQFTRRKRTGCLGGLMYAAFILAVGSILACLAWMVADDVLALTKPDFVAEITVPENYTFDTLADELKDEGLITYKQLFTWFCNIYDAENRIEPGIYQVSSVDYRALVNSMNQSSGELVEQTIMIPEGKTVAEIFEILEQNGVSTIAALEEAAAGTEFDYAFLADVPPGDANRLEGYLFPDTYVFYKNQKAENVLRKMLSNFNDRMASSGIYDLLEEREMTLREALTIAALIEKEAANGEEMPKVSSVIHNRLAAERPLQIDAAIQYILPERKEILTAADLETESPYNTHQNMGLPPGPIANPGVTSIVAAIKPESTNYYYYALHVERYHVFFRYGEQHAAFVNSPDFAHYGQQ